jgi:ParB family chromosome partitioning protein
MGGTSVEQGKERKALGRGLAALIPQASSTPAAGLRELAIERIHPNRRQPRKVFDEETLEELSHSIKVRGVLQPIVVRRRGDEYEIVAGERRWRAAQRAGLDKIPAVVKELSDADAIQVALVENLQRQDLDPLEEAEAFSRLIREHGLSQEAVADAVGKSRPSVTNSLRLLKLPSPILQMLADGRLTAGHARALMLLDADTGMLKLAEAIVERGMSVRDAERQARQLTKKRKPAEHKTPAETNVEERLQRALGTRIRLRHRRGKGRIEIYFHSLAQLNDLLERIDR